MSFHKVAHLTSVHLRYDTRIFLKECISLAKVGFEVYLVVADGLGSEIKEGVKIEDVGRKTGGRLSRITKTMALIFKKARSLNADIYHLHDPELIPVGLKLKKMGKKVIFDAHEDLPKQILSKHYLGKMARRILSKILEWYERKSCKKLDAIVAATPYIRDKFFKIHKNTIDVCNYPILGELLVSQTDYTKKQKHVCYIGGIGEARGIKQMVKAMEFIETPAHLLLGGSFSEKKVYDEVKLYPGWLKVEDQGWLNREEIKKVFESSLAGLVTLHPIINYLDSLPVKMFEYMSAGLPVISSDFSLWKEIIEGNDCGLCVNPLDPQAIAKAIDFLVLNQERARQMGENGRKAVIEKYNWAIEEKKLLKLYESL